MYYNLSIPVDRAKEEELSDEMISDGALSVSRTELNGRIILVAMIDESSCDRFLLRYKSCDIAIEKVEEKDWVNEWVSHYEPVHVDEICVITPPDYPCETDLPVIRIDPRDAFGAGTHPTTILCLTMLYEIIRENADHVDQLSCIDIGTGSGILAIAGQLFGLKKIDGCDIDEKAVIKASENARLNGCPEISFFTSSIENLSADRQYDIVCANLQSVIIENNIDRISKLLTPSGSIITSGIGSKWKKQMRKKFADAGLSVVSERERDEWMGYRLTQL